jgi:hypothetical protein
MKCSIEIFTAGCPLCSPVVSQVKGLASENCTITVYDLFKQSDEKICQEKVKNYSIKHVPSVVLNERLLESCEIETIRAALIGIGKS